ncbi:MAG: (2Fe-2S) ferredoxin domain-containing protein [Myxococcales bacterium]|nr:(2Fe-2S) ferredoxin domain-containing protein [Myxococcales bacterium]
MMAPFEQHIFVCENVREPGNSRGCCAEKGAAKIRERFKKLIADAGLKAQVRANSAGCLDTCDMGVSVVVYPQGVWYGRVTLESVDEIFHEHILNRRPVNRLLLQTLRCTPSEPDGGIT